MSLYPFILLVADAGTRFFQAPAVLHILVLSCQEIVPVVLHEIIEAGGDAVMSEARSRRLLVIVL